MGRIETLHGKTVGVDTAPFIYFIEEHPVFLPCVLPLFEAADRGELELVTSVVTLLEVLVQPLRKQDFSLAERYRDFLMRGRGIRVLPISAHIAEEAARIRAMAKVSTPDSLQLATARLERSVAFVTNDDRLVSLPAPPVIRIAELQ